MPPDVCLIECNEEEHGEAIRDILNEAILNSTALYDYTPRSPASMVAWFAAKREAGHPVIGVADSHSGTLLGFATWGAFRSFPAYKYTVEHSLYIHSSYRGSGLGKLLLTNIIQRAQQAQVHVMVACIDTANSASINLHVSAGFVHAGTFKQVGFKFGQWLDVTFYQLQLTTPDHPADG